MPRRLRSWRVTDGNCVGRRGIYAGMRLALGPCAALAVGGITVVVVSHRVQCADPVFFEMMGLEIGRARSVAVKSRGHFRGGFDEFFGPDQIVEVDLPGLTSPMLSRFEWTAPAAPGDPARRQCRMDAASVVTRLLLAACSKTGTEPRTTPRFTAGCG